jgi:hypothetical protein
MERAKQAGVIIPSHKNIIPRFQQTSCSYRSSENPRNNAIHALSGTTNGVKL